MSVPNQDMVKEFNSQLNSIMGTTVGTQAYMDEIDKKLTPILAELMTLDPRSQEQHTTVKQLAEWLGHPQCTVEMFKYALGPLNHYVSTVMSTHFSVYMTGCPETRYMYLSLAAAEALAIKSPVLQGSWEFVAWFVIRHFAGIPYENTRLNTWIINVVGDADACPNPFLRIELMSILYKPTLSITTNAIAAIMSACSKLTIDYLSGSYYRGCSKFSFNQLCQIFKCFTGIATVTSVDLLKFGEQLANSLKVVNTALITSTSKISYQCGLNHNNFREPRELQSLIALIKTVAGHARLRLKTFTYSQYVNNWDMINVENLRWDCCNLNYIFLVLMLNFKSCYQMPQLIFPTATLFMDVMEYFLTVFLHSCNEDHDEDFGCWEYLTKINKQMEDLLTKNGSIDNSLNNGSIDNSPNNGIYHIDNSPIGREMISRYYRRLRNLYLLVNSLEFSIDYFPVICSLLNHGYQANYI